ncbi:MAG: hypothetical protein E6230_23625 [Paenibacillus dendritiformis]|nr:hypothetical protein [Paenibacillus dendritiformis]MDU5145170.1 hypothetical protein [Paenibacillus dendritiformis]
MLIFAVLHHILEDILIGTAESPVDSFTGLFFAVGLMLLFHS